MSGGNGILAEECQSCPIPHDVSRVNNKLLVLERDVTAADASLTATCDRISELARVLGQEIGRLAQCVARVEAALRARV
jgi:hypothetical protein